MFGHLDMLPSIVICFGALLFVAKIDSIFFPVNPQPEKLAFLQIGRAIACFSVVLAHNSFCYTAHPVNEAVLRVSPALPPHKWGWFVQTIAQSGVGVMIFFLISGYVIALSLRQTSAKAFLVKRFFRIYPVYIICFLLAVGHYFIYKQWMRRDDWWYGGNTLRLMLSEMSLVGDLLGPLTNITEVKMQIAWTLMIEVKFYLLCAVLAKLKILNAIGVTVIALMAAVMWAMAGGTTHIGDAHHVLLTYWWNIILHLLSYMTYMFIGSCVYFYDAHYMSRRSLILAVLCLTVIHMLTCARDRGFAFIPIGGIVIFGMLYQTKMGMGRITNGLANLSYPLYVFHIVCYAFCAWLFAKANVTNPYFGVVSSIAYAIVMAFLISRFVEIPMQRLGARITRGALGREAGKVR
jgi:peptidoglycan/LPS O-acetylase OafA/YrhL